MVLPIPEVPDGITENIQINTKIINCQIVMILKLLIFLFH